MMSKKLFWVDQKSEELKAFRKKVYNSKRWKDTRLHILITQPFCANCAENDFLTPACDVDHIIPLSKIYLEWLGLELIYDVTNLRGLCKKCHGEKSATEGLIKHNKNKLKPR